LSWSAADSQPIHAIGRCPPSDPAIGSTGSSLLLAIAILTVAILTVAILTVAILTVAILTVAILTVAILAVAILAIRCEGLDTIHKQQAWADSGEGARQHYDAKPGVKRGDHEILLFRAG
jgi:fatty acid desaturase